MSSRRKKKKRPKVGYSDVELNIMPFIDVFSLLNTFLLMSAVFVTLGIHEVQIPFLTNTPPEQKTESTRTIEVKVDMQKDVVDVLTSYSQPPYEDTKKSFTITPQGFEEMHQYLVELRRANPETDKVQFYVDDEVVWRDVSLALDSIKIRQENDPVFQPTSNSEIDKAHAANYVYPKVIMSSIMLK